MRRGMILLGFWMCVCMVFLVNAQEHTSRKLYCTDEDRAIFDRYCTQMEPKKSLPLDELMIHTALFFRGTPYVASTLEKEPEGLVVNLRELDCTTFAETVLALSRTLWKKILPLRTSVRIYSSSGTETARSMITRIVCII